MAGCEPAINTHFTEQNEDFENSRTVIAQNSVEIGTRKVKFPQTIRHHKARATIYGKTPGYRYYKVTYQAAGKRRQLTFSTYGEARAEAERVVRELTSGSQATALSASQARDSIAAFQCLEAYQKATGRKLTLLGALSEYVEAAGKLEGQPLGQAVTRYMATVATVKRKDVLEAIEEFIAGNEPRTRAAEGQRAQLSTKHAYGLALKLRRFAGTFQNTSVCDLEKAHLDAFLSSLGKLSSKSRNHYRQAVQQFIQWCVRRDFLASTHRLLEADSMRHEHANDGEVGIYTPKEFLSLLEAADESMRAVIAIGGLAGLRTAELLRLDWADVWRVPDHVEVTAGKAKTRQRRLVDFCPSLALWLEPFRSKLTGKVCQLSELAYQCGFRELCKVVNVKRKANGLRHAYCSYHYALYSNESLTSQQAGNSPSKIHSNYKAITTKDEGALWFAVTPEPTENIVPMLESGEL